MRVTDLIAGRMIGPAAPPVPGLEPPALRRARRRRKVLAVVALLCFAGAAYSATAVSGPVPGYPLVRPQAGTPLDVCSVHPGACPSPIPREVPPAQDARVRFLPPELTGSTGSAIRCDPVSGACEPRSEEPTACDVADSLEAGLSRFPQEISSDIVLPDGRDSLIAMGPGGVIRPIGITYPDGTVAVCGPLQVPYVEDGAERIQAIAADDVVGGLDVGETYAYRFDDTGRLDLVGVRSADGTVTPLGE